MGRADWLSNPVVALVLFGALVAGIHSLGRRWGAQGSDSYEKRQPYACGEDFVQPETRLSYQRFFRLALVFVVVHMAALVVATLPLEFDARLLATIYLLGVGVCVDILVRGQD
jgi:NADH:ubiquinone oxidoreductase subunit 3 (subunit A)